MKKWQVYGAARMCGYTHKYLYIYIYIYLSILLVHIPIYMHMFIYQCVNILSYHINISLYQKIKISKISINYLDIIGIALSIAQMYKHSHCRHFEPRKKKLLISIILVV